MSSDEIGFFKKPKAPVDETVAIEGGAAAEGEEAPVPRNKQFIVRDDGKGLPAALVLKKELKRYPPITQSYILLSCRGRTVNIDRIQQQLEKEGVPAAVFKKFPRLAHSFFFRRGHEEKEKDTPFCETFNCGECLLTKGTCRRTHSCAWCRSKGHGYVECPNHARMAKERSRNRRLTEEKFKAMFAMLNGKHGLGLGFRVEL